MSAATALASGTKSSRGPSPLLTLSRPRALFAQLRRQPSSRPALLWLLASMPVLPISVAVLTYPRLQHLFLAEPELAPKAGAVLFIAILFASALCVVQAVFLLVNFAVFATGARLLGTDSSLKSIRAVWSYAVIPLVLRQLFYVVVVIVQGAEWLRDHAAVLGFIDPFLIATAVLLYIGSRQVLTLSRGRAFLAALLSTFIGAFGALLNSF